MNIVDSYKDFLVDFYSDFTNPRALRGVQPPPFPGDVLDVRRQAINKYGKALESVGYNANLIEINLSQLEKDYNELNELERQAGLPKEKRPKYKVLKAVLNDAYSIPSANADDELNEMLSSAIMPHLNDVEPTTKLDSRVAKSLNIGKSFYDNAKETVLKALGITPDEVDAFVNRKYPDGDNKPDGGSGKIDLNVVGGGSGTSDGSSGGYYNSTSALSYMMNKSIGTFITDEYKGTALKLKQIVGRSLENKLYSAINREFMIGYASASGFNADAHEKAAAKVDSYGLIRQQLDNATVMMESSDLNIRRDGMNIIRNLSLDMQTLNKETAMIQNLGQVAQSLEYIKTLDSNVAETTSKLTNVSTLIEIFNNKWGAIKKLSGKQAKEFTGELSALISNIK